MKLKVPLFKQPKNSVLCGPTCLKMLYWYYGERLDLEDIKKEMRMYNWGTLITELGRSLLKHNFNVALTTFNTRWFPNTFKSMSSNDLKRYIIKKMHTSKKQKRLLKSMVSFIEEGGKLKVDIVTEKDIKKAIKSKNPPIICIDNKVLFGKKPGKRGHFVIPVGINKDKIVINDPHSKNGGIKSYDKNKIIFALYSWSASTLFIKPK